jgi:hypothetical protein
MTSAGEASRDRPKLQLQPEASESLVLDDEDDWLPPEDDEPPDELDLLDELLELEPPFEELELLEDPPEAPADDDEDEEDELELEPPLEAEPPEEELDELWLDELLLPPLEVEPLLEVEPPWRVPEDVPPALVLAPPCPPDAEEELVAELPPADEVPPDDELPPTAELPPLLELEAELPPLPPAPVVPPLPPLPPPFGSAGGVPRFPVSLSPVMAKMTRPFEKPTFLALWVDCPIGDFQSPRSQPSGIVDPEKSSRHFCSKLPLLYVEYWTQLMYSRTGRVVLLMFPPKSWVPGQMLKWKVIPDVAF